MRKTFILTLVLLVVAAFAYAQGTGSTTSTTTTTTATGSGSGSSTTTTTTHHKTTASHHVHGTVASVDAGTKTIVVHPKTGADVTLKANDKTSYWVGKTKGSWDDVKQGGMVTATYHPDGTDNWALRVTVPAEKAAPAAGSAPKTGK
jgi:hypothetical protein